MKGTAGFTLVEVMVAVCVGSLLIVGVAVATRSTVATSERQKAEACQQEATSRALEILRHDWRGRRAVRRVSTPAPPGERRFILEGTSDGLSQTLQRAVGEVLYMASERGLIRKEAGVDLTLLESSVNLDFWDGKGWVEEPPRNPVALRLSFVASNEIVFLR